MTSWSGNSRPSARNATTSRPSARGSPTLCCSRPRARASTFSPARVAARSRRGCAGSASPDRTPTRATAIWCATCRPSARAPAGRSCFARSGATAARPGCSSGRSSPSSSPSACGLLHGEAALAAIGRLNDALKPVADWIGAHGEWFDRASQILLRPRRVGDRAQPVARARLLEPAFARRAAAQPRGPRTAPRSGCTRDAAQSARRRADRRGRSGGASAPKRRASAPAARRPSARRGRNFSNRATRPPRRRARFSPPSAPGSDIRTRRRRRRTGSSLRSTISTRCRRTRRSPGSTRRRARSGPAAWVCWLSIPPGLRSRSAARAKRGGDSENGCRSPSTCRLRTAPTASGWSRGFCRPRGQPRRRSIRSCRGARRAAFERGSLAAGGARARSPPIRRATPSVSSTPIGWRAAQACRGR